VAQLVSKIGLSGGNGLAVSCKGIVHSLKCVGCFSVVMVLTFIVMFIHFSAMIIGGHLLTRPGGSTPGHYHHQKKKTYQHKDFFD
jgi:hypothetical protein